MKVLITGGGCSEKIDNVRSITNFSSGKTAGLIARTIKALNPAAAISLLLAERAVQAKGFETKNFRSCDDLKKLLQSELKENSYDLIFQAAAVSDYSVQSLTVDGKEFLPGRISKISGADDVTIKLKKNPKLLEAIPRWAKENNKGAVVVGFKLTSNASQEERAAAVKKLFAVKNPPDYVISNDLSEITPKSHPCVLWQKDKIIMSGQIKAVVRKINALNS